MFLTSLNFFSEFCYTYCEYRNSNAVKFLVGNVCAYILKLCVRVNILNDEMYNGYFEIKKLRILK